MWGQEIPWRKKQKDADEWKATDFKSSKLQNHTRDSMKVPAAKELHMHSKHHTERKSRGRQNLLNLESV